MIVKSMDEGPTNSVGIVEILIRGYVKRHPRSSDTIHGIRRYWLPKQREWLVREAVGRLVERGEVQVGTGPTGVEYVLGIRLAKNKPVR